MRTPIKTNELNINLDKEKINELYDIYKITTDENYFKYTASIFDHPALLKKVRSVRYSNGNHFWVLFNKHEENSMRFKTAILELENKDSLRFVRENIFELENSIILQLLLNSLGSAKHDLLSFNNLTGSLYCFHPNWLIWSTNSKNKWVKQIPTLKLSIEYKENKYYFTAKGITFSNIKLQEYMTFKKRKFNEYAQYTLSIKNTLKRKFGSSKNSVFIIKPVGKKILKPYLDIENISKFEQSKLGIIQKIISDFNKQFQNFAQLSFNSTNDYTVLDYTTETAKENKAIIDKKIIDYNFSIIDLIKTAKSQLFCSQIQANFDNLFSIKVKKITKPLPNYQNILIVHNKEYYRGNEDPYQTDYKDIAVQHITLEDFSEDSKEALNKIIQELLIKQDIINGQITLFNWDKLQQKTDITFGICKEIQNINRYFFMCIQPDGSFNCFEQEFSLFDQNDFFRCLTLFDTDDERREKTEVEGIVIVENNINIIRNTTWFTIPELKEIQNYLKDGNNKLRSKQKQDELFPGIIDITLFNKGNHSYYVTGGIGRGMKRKIQRASIVRKIEAFENSQLFFTSLLPLMNVTFVRNGMLTVLPFPFKYLREYITMNS